jgi:hypothetical protein
VKTRRDEDPSGKHLVSAVVLERMEELAGLVVRLVASPKGGPAQNISGKHKFVVIRERGGETLPGVFDSEGHDLSWIKGRVAKGHRPAFRRSRRVEQTACALRNEAHQPPRSVQPQRRVNEPS